MYYDCFALENAEITCFTLLFTLALNREINKNGNRKTKHTVTTTEGLV